MESHCGKIAHGLPCVILVGRKQVDWYPGLICNGRLDMLSASKIINIKRSASEDCNSK